MSTNRVLPPNSTARRRPSPMSSSHIHLSTPLCERFAVFDAFIREMNADPKTCVPKITPSPLPPSGHGGAGRRCVKRVPVPVFPTVPECPEEEEEAEETDTETKEDVYVEDYLVEAESTTACDDAGSPVYASPQDKPLPFIPFREKALPRTPINKNKSLPPLPPPPPLPAKGMKFPSVPRTSGIPRKSPLICHREHA
ncbi:hypothetical protein C8Q79DRAFT_50020 [Trametes meyenii]|nr:hypothetical protein C8Q79DRAFT_50020 [Trametes meyenii]